MIDGKPINEMDVISRDHDLIYFNFNYSDPFSVSFPISINAFGVPSNIYTLSYPPLPISVNNVSKSKGGNITIHGSRLSSLLPNSNVTVMIDSFPCSNVISSSNEITCDLHPITTSSNDVSAVKDIPVIVSVNGISNQVQLLFSYDTVKINGYSQVNQKLNLIGDCFGNSNSTKIMIDGDELIDNSITTESNETMLSFQIPKSKLQFKISIISNGIKSNEINVQIQLFTRVLEFPKLGALLVVFKSYYINSSNIILTPTITIGPNQTIINGVLNGSNQDDGSSLYSFNIQNKMCGVNSYQIKIGSQSHQSSFSYQSPIITSCLINSSDIANCIGDGFGSLDQCKIIISNDTLLPLSVNNSKSITFSTESYKYTDENDELVIEVCGLMSDTIKLQTTPIFKYISSPIVFGVKGGSISINGKYLNQKTSLSIECANESINNNCTSNNNNEEINCFIPLSGPFDRACNLKFNNQQPQQSFIISYKSPSIEQIIGNVDFLQGGIITIIGNEFYDPVQSVIIGNEQCLNITFINHKSLSCELAPITNNIDESQLYDNLLNVTVTVNGKNGTSKIFKYSKNTTDKHPNSSNSIKINLYFILIILFISLFILNF